MTEMSARDRLVAHIRAERDWWADLVAEIGEHRMTEPGPMGEWTFKDLAAHLLGWRDRTIGRLEAVAQGNDEPAPPWPTELVEDDDIHAWIHEGSRHRSVQEVMNDVDLSYERLEKAVSALEEELVARPGAMPGLEGQALADADFFGHVHDEHEPSIRAWLDGEAAARG